MRIAIFSDHFYPELGGIQDSLIYLGKSLAQLGHEVNFYAAKYSAKDYKKANLPVEELDLGSAIKFTRFYSLPFPSPTQQFRLVIPSGQRWRTVKKFKPDIIHVHTFWGLGLEALHIAKKLKLPLVGTNHWTITDFFHYFPWQNAFKKWSLKLVVWFYSHCNFVTAPSHVVLQEMSDAGFKKPRQVMSNQIDLEIFKPYAKAEIEKIKSKFNISNNSIVYAGRLAQEKKIDVIIKAVALVKKQIPEINFIIAGHGSAEASLKELCKNLKVEEQIKFLGTLDKPTLAKVYGACQIFTIASTSESQSMVLLQAMACGLPAIGVRWKALAEYVNEQNGLLVEADDYEAMAEKIIYLLKNHDIRQILGHGAKDYVQQFSVPNIAKQWERLYQETINKFNNRL